MSVIEYDTAAGPNGLYALDDRPLNDNPYMVGGVSPWLSYGATVTWEEASDALYGDGHVLRAAFVSSAVIMGAYQNLPRDVAAGHPASMRVRVRLHGTNSCALRFYTAVGGSTISTTAYSGLAEDVWHELTATMNNPLNKFFDRVYIWSAAGNAAGDYIEIDAARVDMAPTPLPFVPMVQRVSNSRNEVNIAPSKNDVQSLPAGTTIEYAWVSNTLAIPIVTQPS